MLRNFERIGPLKLFALIAVVYFLSSLVQVGLNEKNKVTGIFLGLPMVYTGDEPSYLTPVFSLVNDSDLHLANNIENAHSGKCDQGVSYAGKKIELGLVMSEPAPTLKKMPGFEDYPSRPIGLPVAAAVFLMAFQNTCLLEPFSIWLSLLATVAGIAFFYLTARHFFPRHAVFFTFALAFCTPLWHYSRTFWTEPWTFLLLTASLYFLLVKKNAVISSFLIGFAAIVQHSFIIVAAIFVLKVFLERRPKKFVAFVIPLVFVAFLYCAFNLGVFGSVLSPRDIKAASQGDIFSGMASVFFDPNFGMLFSFPVIVFFFFAFLVSKNKKQLLFPVALVVSFILFYSSLDWIVFGTGGFGFRYLLPLYAAVFLVLGLWFGKEKNFLIKKLFYVCLFVSLLVNAQAAFFAPLLVANPPWFLIAKLAG